MYISTKLYKAQNYLTKSNNNNYNKIAIIHKNNNRHNFQSNTVNKYQILLLIHKFGKTRQLKPQLVRAMDCTSQRLVINLAVGLANGMMRWATRLQQQQQPAAG